MAQSLATPLIIGLISTLGGPEWELSRADQKRFMPEDQHCPVELKSLLRLFIQVTSISNFCFAVKKTSANKIRTVKLLTFNIQENSHIKVALDRNINCILKIVKVVKEDA